MKASTRFWGAISALVAAGLVYGVAGFWKPGQMAWLESAGGATKPLLSEARKKDEFIRQGSQDLKTQFSRLAGLEGGEGEHRVFVSAQLVYLPDNPEPVQPLDRKMKTEDGIEVGWKMKYGLDPADPRIKEEDLDEDGFTNLEEFVAGTDPTRKENSPAKESKLKSRSPEPLGMAVSFPEKSGGVFTIRFQVGSKRAEFKGKPGTTFWVMAGPEGVEVFTDPAKMTAARSRAKESGKNSHVIPVAFTSYQEKLEKVKDMKAGGVEVEVDNSYLVLERKDAVPGPQRLALSSPQRPQTLAWDVGEIRFYSPVSGGVELGPFRVGEAFSYEGKEFAILGREGKKIQVRSLEGAGKEPFSVPVETNLMPPDKP